MVQFCWKLFALPKLKVRVFAFEVILLLNNWQKTQWHFPLTDLLDIFFSCFCINCSSVLSQKCGTDHNDIASLSWRGHCVVQEISIPWPYGRGMGGNGSANNPLWAGYGYFIEPHILKLAQSSFSAKPLIWKGLFILMQIKLIFKWKILHLASFRGRGFWNLEMAHSTLLSNRSDTSNVFEEGG